MWNKLEVRDWLNLYGIIPIKYIYYKGKYVYCEIEKIKGRKSIEVDTTQKGIRYMIDMEK